MLTKKRVEAIAHATLGMRRYLVPTIGGLRWSDYPEKDDDSRHDDWEPGCKIYVTVETALGDILKATGFLINPDTGAFMLFLID